MPGLVLAFVLLALVLRTGVALGVAYGIWGGTSVALTAALGALVFGEALTALMLVGIAFIVAGVLLVDVGAHGTGPSTRARTP